MPRTPRIPYRRRRLLAAFLGPLALGALLAAAPSPRADGWAATPFEPPVARFAAVMGYEPVAAPGAPGAPDVLVRPDGDCSTPTGGTVFGFEDACREHDLAYDVLRYRAAVGERIDVRERWTADARFALRMAERCASRPGLDQAACLGVAGVYAAAVSANSVRQRFGAPVEESGVQIATSTLALALLLTVPFAPTAGARAFRRRLRREELDLPQPAPATLWAGSPGSLLAWGDLGREGRRLLSRPPVAPGALRVFVGLESARRLRARIDLALAEAERAGAFERGTVCVTVPTGSGWLNPAAVEALERATDGDVATVCVQYAAAPSWLAAIAHPGAHRWAAEALLEAVHERLQQLSPAERPRLVVHGESLGANAIASALAWRPELAAEVDGGLLVGAVGSARWGEVLGGKVGVFVHDDDPVAQLSPFPRPRQLLALRGAAAAPLGTGHRYGPELEEAWRRGLAPSLTPQSRGSGDA